jgi:hypothetical protein
MSSGVEAVCFLAQAFVQSMSVRFRLETIDSVEAGFSWVMRQTFRLREIAKRVEFPHAVRKISLGRGFGLRSGGFGWWAVSSLSGIVWLRLFLLSGGLFD